MRNVHCLLLLLIFVPYCNADGTSTCADNSPAVIVSGQFGVLETDWVTNVMDERRIRDTPVDEWTDVVNEGVRTSYNIGPPPPGTPNGCWLDGAAYQVLSAKQNRRKTAMEFSYDVDMSASHYSFCGINIHSLSTHSSFNFYVRGAPGTPFVVSGSAQGTEVLGGNDGSFNFDARMFGTFPDVSLQNSGNSIFGVQYTTNDTVIHEGQVYSLGFVLHCYGGNSFGYSNVIHCPLIPWHTSEASANIKLTIAPVSVFPKICFYVKDGIVGHSWVEFDDGLGNVKSYGKYPSLLPFIGPAEIKDEFGPRGKNWDRWTRRICFDVTPGAYDAALEFVEMEHAQTSPYWLNLRNCTTFVEQVAEVAGIDLPPTLFPYPVPGMATGDVIWMHSPAYFNHNLGNTKGAEDNCDLRRDRGFGEALTFDPILFAQFVSNDPVAAADMLGVEVRESVLESVQVGVGEDLAISLTGVMDGNVATSFDFGDGTEVAFLATYVEHGFAEQGSYHLDIRLVDDSALHRFSVPVEVVALGSPAQLNIEVPDLPPANIDNVSGPAEFIAPPIANAITPHFRVIHGNYLSGSTDDIKRSDDQSVFCQSSEIGKSESKEGGPERVELRVDAHTPRSPQQITNFSVSVEASVGLGTKESLAVDAPTFIDVFLRDWTNGGLVKCGTFLAGSTDATFTVDGLDAADFLRGFDHRIEVRLRAQSSGGPFTLMTDEIEIRTH